MGKLMKLEKGMKFRMLKDDEEIYEVLHVGTNALVRSLAKKHHSFSTSDGKDVDFMAPGKKVTISAYSDVFLVEEER
jgi:hypothetical protein